MFSKRVILDEVTSMDCASLDSYLCNYILVLKTATQTILDFEHVDRLEFAPHFIFKEQISNGIRFKVIWLPIFQFF